MNSTTNQVRQILTNELGLTRESIRQHAEQFIADVVERHMNSLHTSGRLNDILAKVIDRVISPKGYASLLRDLCQQTAEMEVRRMVRERVLILPPRQEQPPGSRMLAVSRDAVSGGTSIRAVSADGSEVANLDDTELAKVKAALRNYGLQLYGD